MRLPVATILVVLLFLPAGAVAAEVLIFTDGARMQVQKYEIKKNVVVITTMDGKLRSIPSNYINLDATNRLNGRQPASPAKQPLLCQDRNPLRRPRRPPPSPHRRSRNLLRHPDGPLRRFRPATCRLRFGRTTNWA